MQPGEWFFVATKSASGEWVDKPFRRGQWKGVLEFVEANKDKNLYICPHGFSKPHRKREYAVPPKLLWADLDEVDPRKVIVKPTMAWETSPGRYAALWVTDRPVTDELNQRWTYLLGADKGGWDYSQVLRLIAGSTNYKYPSRPKVRLLWNDGDSVDVSAIEKLTPAKAVENASDDWRSIYDKYEKILPHWVRRELMNKRVPVGKRSEMLWKLEHALLEAGVSREEAFVILRASAWNKFADRRNGDDQLRRELDKALGNGPGLNGAKVKPPNGSTHESAADTEILIKFASETPMKKRKWLWRDWLAHNSYHLIAGLKGTAKSTLTFKMAATISAGAKWPDGSTAPRGVCVIWNGEDDVEETIIPRLVVAGADLSRVAIVSTVKEEGVKRPFDPSVDFDALLVMITKLNETKDPTRKVRFLTLDPVIMVLSGRTDSHKAAEVRRDTQPLVYAAKELDIGIVGVTHFSKNSHGLHPTDRVLGSQAMTALPRVVMLAVKAPTEMDPNRRMFIRSDNNIGKDGGGFEYRLETSAVPQHLELDDATHIEWGEFLEGSATQLIAEAEGKGDEDDEKGASEFLKETLTAKPQLAAKVIELGEKRGYDAKLLKRVVKHVGVVAGSRLDEQWTKS